MRRGAGGRRLAAEVRFEARRVALQPAANPTQRGELRPREVATRGQGGIQRRYAVALRKHEAIAIGPAPSAQSYLVIEKIVEGKLENYYQEVCLVKQPFVLDDKLTIGGMKNLLRHDSGLA